MNKPTELLLGIAPPENNGGLRVASYRVVWGALNNMADRKEKMERRSKSIRGGGRVSFPQRYHRYCDLPDVEPLCRSLASTRCCLPKLGSMTIVFCVACFQCLPCLAFSVALFRYSHLRACEQHACSLTCDR